MAPPNKRLAGRAEVSTLWPRPRRRSIPALHKHRAHPGDALGARARQVSPPVEEGRQALAGEREQGAAPHLGLDLALDDDLREREREDGLVADEQAELVVGADGLDLVGLGGVPGRVGDLPAGEELAEE